MQLKIAVCIKPVPKEESSKKITIDEKTKSLKRSQAEHVINAPDKNALETAISLVEKFGGSVDVYSMAPPFAELNLREALAMGADNAYLLSDMAFAGSDSLATANIISTALKKNGEYNLIICGSHTSDSGTAQVPAEIAEYLGIAHLHRVYDVNFIGDGLEIKCIKDSLSQTWIADMPIALSLDQSINKPRYTNVRGIMKAAKKPLHRIDCNTLGINRAEIGIDGSPSKCGPIHTFSVKRQGEVFKGDTVQLAEKFVEKLALHNIL